MSVEPSKESFTYTLRAFWTGKRFVKLFVFALLLGHLTAYCVSTLAKRQLIGDAAGRHNKVYISYLQAVERARKNMPSVPAVPAPTVSSATNPGAQTGSASSEVMVTGVDGGLQGVSPYWVALREVRREFPYHRMNIVLQGTAEGERDHKILDLLKSRPRDWMVSDEDDGWARSFYVLPTRNVAAFQVVSDVRDEIGGWETTAIIMGSYAFVLLFAFGWFWTRALDESQGLSARPQLKQTVAGIRSTSDQLGGVVGELRESLITLERGPLQRRPRILHEVDEIASQIRMLAVNGSIEAARSAETHRVFHVLMQEINHLATHSRKLLKALDPAGAEESASESAAQPSPVSGTAVRRVG